MRGSSVLLASAMALVLSVGGYALVRNTGMSEPRSASRQDTRAALEAQLATRVHDLDRREAALLALQSAARAQAVLSPVPQPGATPPSAALPADPEEEPVETPESIVAFDAAQHFVDDAIASQAPWDEVRRLEMHRKMRGLSRSQLDSVMSSLAVAINTGKLEATVLPPL